MPYVVAKAAITSDPNLYYFSYGANMNPKTLSKRNLSELKPLGPARTPDNVYFGFAHRGAYATLLSPQFTGFWFRWQDFSSINADTTPPPSSNTLFHRPYGLVYSVTQQQLNTLAEKEIGYCLVDINVHLLSNNTDNNNDDNGTDDILSAKTFVSTPWTVLKTPVKPNTRYHGLILSALQSITGSESDDDNTNTNTSSSNNEYVKWMSSVETVEANQMYRPEYSATLSELVARGVGVAVLTTLTAQFLYSSL